MISHLVTAHTVTELSVPIMVAKQRLSLLGRTYVSEKDLKRLVCMYICPLNYLEMRVGCVKRRCGHLLKIILR